MINKIGKGPGDGNEVTPQSSNQVSSQVTPGVVAPDTIASLQEKKAILKEEIHAIDDELRNKVEKFEEKSLENEFRSQYEKLEREVIYPFLQRILREKFDLDPILINDKKDKQSIGVNSWYLIGDSEGTVSNKIETLSKIKDKKLLFYLLPDELEATSDYPEYKDKCKYMDLLIEKIGLREKGINPQIKNYYDFIEYKYELGKFKEQNKLTIQINPPGYKISYVGLNRNFQNSEINCFTDEISYMISSKLEGLFWANEEPYLTGKEEFFQQNPTIKKNFDKIDRSIHDISARQNELVTYFEEREISPWKNTRQEKKDEIKEIEAQIKKLEEDKRQEEIQNRIREKEKALQIRNQKALLEGDNNLRYMLYPSNWGSFSGIGEDLYGKEIELSKQPYKSGGEYNNITFNEYFENKELGIFIGLYSKEFYLDGPESEMCIYNGLFVKRSDGTYNKGPEFKWRNSDGDVDESVKISSVNNVKIVNNRIIVEVKLGDGSIKDLDIGIFKLPPVYTVYRNNDSYLGYRLQGILSKLGRQNRLIDSTEGIFDVGTDIVENDFIRSIPDDAVVVTDNAALRALPSLANKKIINIEKDILPGMITSSGLATLPYYVKKIDSNPSKIKILSRSCADHPELPDYGHNEGGKNDQKYAIAIQTQLKEIFPNSEIVITSNLEDFKNDDNTTIKVIDRHRLGEREWKIKKDSKTLILPLYENDKGDNEELKSYIKDSFIDELKKYNS